MCGYEKNRYLEDIVKDFNLYNDVPIEIENAKDILSRGIFIRPNTINDDDNYRMREQKGTFAIPGNRIENGSITNIIPFDNDSSYEEIVIPFEYQEEIRNELTQRGYTRKRLLGEDDKLIKYNELSKDNIKKINGKYVQKAYYQYSVTIEMYNLMTIKEMGEMGYQIAKESKADSVRIWFRRLGSEDGNNIINQHWYKESINRYGWQGKKYRELMLDEQRGSSNIVNEYYRDKNKIKIKRLPVEANAEVVYMNVALENQSQLVIDTNLLKGTELLVVYTIDNKDRRSIRIIVEQNLIKLDINHGQHVNKVEGQVIMPVPAVQKREVRQAYGIDYEKITGDFIQRNDDDFMISGCKKFSFEIRN